PEERDKDLDAKLQSEWAGILSWMIAGCLEWQRIGLAPPHAVLDATAAYLADEDSLAAWMEDCTQREPNAWEASTSLWESWRKWCQRNAEAEGSHKAFGAKLEQSGFAPKKDTTGNRRGYAGLKLIPR